MQIQGGLFTLRNAQNMQITISEFGASLVSWLAPDRDGQLADVLLGHPDVSGYIENSHYFGAVAGRWANRIKHGRFMLDGTPQQVVTNDRGNHLHGGPKGFFQARWQGTQTPDGITCRLFSPDGDAGFSGALEVQVHYQLTDNGCLMINFEAVSNAPTAINLTSHPYFNLNGGRAGIGNHILQINADYYMQIDDSGVAAAMAGVEGTAFDFRRPAAIGPRLASHDQQVRLARGFDHYFCTRMPGQASSASLREVARVNDPISGRQLLVSTTEAGLQFYSGNALDGVPGRNGLPYKAYDGFCLEAHARPDQINGPDAQEVILRPEQTYRHTTVYQLGVC